MLSQVGNTQNKKADGMYTDFIFKTSKYKIGYRPIESHSKYRCKCMRNQRLVLLRFYATDSARLQAAAMDVELQIKGTKTQYFTKSRNNMK